MEGSYSFDIEIFDTINGESFTKTFLIKAIDNPCEPGIDTSKSTTGYMSRILDRPNSQQISMALGDDNLLVNGDCQYDIVFYDIDCADESTRTGALSNPAV